MSVTRYVRFASDRHKEPSFGVLADDAVRPLSAAPWLGGEPMGERLSRNSITLLSPVTPSKIVCVGLNYHAHVEASYSADKAPERPLLFLKPPSAIIGPEEKIEPPTASQRVDYEAELVIVIGRKAKAIASDKAEQVIFGFTCGNDVTARDLQKVDGQWTRAKGFDTFCPVGPWIVPELNYRDTLVEGIHNDEVKQSGRTSQMIFDIPFLVAYISGIMTLYPGDIIFTGTPSGIAPMLSGDKIEIHIEGIGSLVNHMA